MVNEFENKKTGIEAFDNVFTSLSLLHEYINEADDEQTFVVAFGGAKSSEDSMQLLAASVGNLSNPRIYQAVLHLFTSTMKDNSTFAKLIMEAYHNYQTDGNVKVVKMSVDSPLEALLAIKRLMENNVTPNFDDMPLDVLEMLIDSLPPNLAKMYNEKELCDDPDCRICKIKRKLNAQNRKSDLPLYPIFGRKPDKEQGN